MGIHEMKTNTNMTDEDRNLCGVVNDSGTYTLSPVADVAPFVQYLRTGMLGGMMTFIDPVSELGGKPNGQDGVVVTFGFYVPGGVVPAEEDCTQTIIGSRRKRGVIFKSTNMNKSFVGYARYKNTRNILGTIAFQFFGTVC